MPQVSVIVTTYNRKDLLAETINSILTQTFTDFELIVVDNCSNYNFSEHIKSFKDPRILPFQNQNNGIIAVNRNLGIRRAKGEYIAFCDDDDTWFPNKLEQQIKKIKQHPNEEFILIHSNAILVSEKKRDVITKKKDVKTFNNFISCNHITCSTVILSKSQIVIFDEDPIIRASEDYFLWIELVSKGYKFYLIDAPLITYRVLPNAASRTRIELSYLRYIYVLSKAIIKLEINQINVFQVFKSILLNITKYIIRSRFNNISYKL